MVLLTHAAPSVQDRGFTLIELLVTVLVAAVILTIGVPSLVAFVQNNALAGAVNQFTSTLNYARSEAVKRDAAVCICPSANGTTCGANWAQGWIVYPEATSTASCDTVQTSIQTGSALPGSGMTLTSDAASPKIGYRPDGSLVANTSITFKLCDARGAKYARSLQISSGGRTLIAATPGYMVDNITHLTCP
ncbi:MAG TPA: GspH/FimT family pseudopilin [Terriglobales bacterium]|nr:GspH/FimT family pseudopilin [Terriglobales bacterium]